VITLLLRILYFFFFFFLLIRRPLSSTLFPYTTLFRSSLYSIRSTSDCAVEKILFAFPSYNKDISYVSLQNDLVKFVLFVLHDLRSEEHTSELQSRFDLVCRLLLEKKKYK